MIAFTVNSRRARHLAGVAVSSIALAMAFATPAHAQDTPGDVVDESADVQGDPADQSATDESADTEGNTVVVTGIRAGIQASIDIKRRETSIVEAVSAEDIGKLPDISIAESIARLPGLAAQRVGGRAQTVSIRGLAPDFATTLLNGRQQASSGDNRAVEFDQYPSELLGSVVVYKTPDANVSGMGLSGSVDLRTVRPLEFGKRAIALNLRGDVNTGGKGAVDPDGNRVGGRFSASYIDQFFDGTLGIAIGYAYLDSPSQTRHHKNYGFESFGGVCQPTAAAPCAPNSVTPDSADADLLVNGQEIFATAREQKRNAALGIVEWQPSDSYHATMDVYYSNFKQDERTRGAQWFSNAWADNAYFTGVETVDRGGSPFGASGVLHNAVPIIRNDWNKREDNLFAIGLNNEFQLADRLKAVVDLSYSRNHREEQIAETYAGYGLGTGGVTPGTPDVGRTPDTVAFEFGNDGFPTYSEGLNYADARKVSLGDRAPWGGWGHDGAIRFPDVVEKVYTLDAGLAYDTDGFFDQFDVGVNYTRREKNKTVDDRDLFLKNGRQQVLVGDEYLDTPVSLGFAGFGQVLNVNLPKALPIYYDQAPILDANYYDKTWEIQEDVITARARAQFETGPLRGNIGIQVVHQKQESTGVIIQGSPIVPLPITDGDEYTDVLPSANLIYELGGGHRFRLAASKTMARPRMDEMRANVTPGFNSLVCTGQPCAPGTVVHPWSASGGNPNLKPWRATAFDAAYEWYIDRTTYISIAGFYKDLDTYIYTRTSTFDFTGIPLPPGATSIPAGVTIDPIGQISLPANGNGGTLKGLEFSGSLNFGTLTRYLDGFGVLGSLSLTESSLNPTDATGPGTKTRIPGLSDTVYNITGYYEKGGFQVRASYRYRSAFKGEVVQLFATRGQTEILADEQVDAQIGYTFPEGSSLENLGFLLQVFNLTDSPYRTRLGLDSGGTHTADGGSLIETYEQYGRQVLFGVNYRF